MWADTTPGIAAYEVEQHHFNYVNSNGKPKVAKLPLALTIGSRAVYWDATYFGSADKPTGANRVIAAHAEQLGIEYELFDTNRLGQNLAPGLLPGM